MIKVVHFIHGLNMGGAETLVKNYALYLDKTKFNVTVLCYEHFDSPYEYLLRQNNIDVIYVCDQIPKYQKPNMIRRALNHYQLYWLIRKELKKQAPDIVHFHLGLSRYIRFARLKKGVRLFYTQHFSTDTLEKDCPEYIADIRWLLKHYDVHLIALHEAMKKSMDDIFQINNTKVLNNGVDIEAFRSPLNLEEKRAELGIPSNAFAVVHVGRFDPVKNHDFLVEVFAELKKKKNNAFLLMVGKGKTERQVCDKLKKLGLEDSYKILHDRTDVAEILRACDAAVFPSISEGISITAIEMQAAGIPCVASTGVPKAACVSNRICFLGLNLSAERWADELLEMVNANTPIQYHGIEEWDIRHNVKQLEMMYEEAMLNG